ncbi:MAG TPA: response regulator transcription factor [Acidimicrobiia bacterium]|nr:response regulator transcription factor [Acidimicrobiia bacterium]
MAQILIVEDDDRIRETTRILLEDEGYVVHEAVTGEEGLALLESTAPDCVLLDLLLPGRDGFDICRSMRRMSQVPVIMLTARTDTYDVVAGLEAGADDYVTKPFEPKELAARIRAQVRRSRVRPPDAEPLRIRDLTVNLVDGTVHRAGQEVPLTRTEFQLLAVMVAHPGRIFSREVLLGEVWGYDELPDSKVVDMHVHRLRLKLEPDPSQPRYVTTVRGRGYRINP